MEFHRYLGISYKAAWRMKHKLMQVMLERDQAQPLSGWIEEDDAYIGGEWTGCKRGRGTADKTPFIAAVETTTDGKPLKIKLTVLSGFRKKAIAEWTKQHVLPESTIFSDGLGCFNGISDADCDHVKIVCGGGRASIEKLEFYWVNTTLGNLKSALRSTYHAVRKKYLQRYLSEFQYRFNRRFDLKNFIPRRMFVSVRTPTMPDAC